MHARYFPPPSTSTSASLTSYAIKATSLLFLFQAKDGIRDIGVTGVQTCAPSDLSLIRRDGALLATPLLAVLVLVEVTDVVFAVDSIPAIFAVTDEPFLVFTANAFAILGLRAMYYLLADLIHRFVYLKTGLALVLIWVGVKMLLKVDLLYVPTAVSLAVISLIIGVSIAASLRATRGQGRRALQAPSAPPFRIASEDELATLQPVWSRGTRGRSEERRVGKECRSRWSPYH